MWRPAGQAKQQYIVAAQPGGMATYCGRADDAARQQQTIDIVLLKKYTQNLPNPIDRRIFVW
jgi:hypothetical protein